MSEITFENVGEDYISLTDGLKKKITQEGHGEVPPLGSKVNVHYVGTLLSDGTKFDSSRDRNVPFSFDLGKGSVIKGWDEGVATMKTGEIAELVCAPEYAYGAAGSPPKIPPNATLKFEVEMIDFTEPLDAPEKKVDAALAKKEEGNKYFKAGQYTNAKSAYEKGKELIQDTWDAENDVQKMAAELTIALGANITMCSLKLSKYGDAIKEAKEVLKNDPTNIKTIWRLGQAYMHTGEYEDGLAVVKDGLKLAPEDPNLKSVLSQIQQKQADYHKKEKARYKKMFDGN
jgi:peptidylprolyl isomerase